MAVPYARTTRDHEQDERLIRAVRKHRPLWDNSTPLHKNVRVLMYCWQKIAEELCMNEKVIRKKWKGLRDYFFRQVKELERNGVDVTNEDTNTKFCLWPLYDSLTFLIGNKTSSTYTDYKLTEEERVMLEEVTEFDMKQRLIVANRLASSSPDSNSECSPVSTPTPVLLIENKANQDITDESRQSQMPMLQIINPTSNTLQEKGRQPQKKNKMNLCGPPPLRVFKQATNAISEAPPSKKYKISPESDNKQSGTMSGIENDPDLHFFKSLLPFMRALPLVDKLRVRTGIQDLILGELEAVRTKNNMLGMTSRATSSVCDPLATPYNENDETDQDSFLNASVTVKEEFELDSSVTVNEEFESNPSVTVKGEVEDDQYLLLEVDPKKITFENDDSCSDD